VHKIKSYFSVKRISAIFGLILLFLFTQVAAVEGQAVTQGYNADSVLQRGTVVSLDAEDTTKVVSAARENQDRLHGVVVAPNDAALTLSDVEEKTFVATIGRYDVFVSNESGPINPGDFLTISSVTGIATKAGDKDLYAIGKAIEGFGPDSESISTTTITDTLGNTTPISIGRIQIDIAVGSNPLFEPSDSNLPGFLKRASEAIAGKEVSTVRVYIGLAILFVASGIAGSLLYSGVRSSLISLGRNPLSKKSITKGLIQIILTSIIIFLFGLFGVYLLLRL
jgi:hypothetical protein